MGSHKFKADILDTKPLWQYTSFWKSLQLKGKMGTEESKQLSAVNKALVNTQEEPYWKALLLAHVEHHARVIAFPNTKTFVTRFESLIWDIFLELKLVREQPYLFSLNMANKNSLLVYRLGKPLAEINGVPLIQCSIDLLNAIGPQVLFECTLWQTVSFSEQQKSLFQDFPGDFLYLFGRVNSLNLLLQESLTEDFLLLTL